MTIKRVSHDVEREKFEVLAKKFYGEQKMSRYQSTHYTKANEYIMPNYQSAWEGYQLATAQQAKKQSQ